MRDDALESEHIIVAAAVALYTAQFRASRCIVNREGN